MINGTAEDFYYVPDGLPVRCRYVHGALLSVAHYPTTQQKYEKIGNKPRKAPKNRRKFYVRGLSISYLIYDATSNPSALYATARFANEAIRVPLVIISISAS